MNEVIPDRKMRLRSFATPPEKKTKYLFCCCPECGYGFATREDMHSHLKKEHKICVLCQTEFESLQDLKEHSLKLHAKLYCYKCKVHHKNKKEYDACVKMAMVSKTGIPKKLNKVRKLKRCGNINQISAVKKEAGSDKESVDGEDEFAEMEDVESAKEEPHCGKLSDKSINEQPEDVATKLAEKRIEENIDEQVEEPDEEQSEDQVTEQTAGQFDKLPEEQNAVSTEMQAENPSYDLVDKEQSEETAQEAPVAQDTQSALSDDAEQQEQTQTSENVEPEKENGNDPKGAARIKTTIFGCEVCGIHFTNRASYLNHMNYHKILNERIVDSTVSTTAAKASTGEEVDNEIAIRAEEADSTTAKPFASATSDSEVMDTSALSDGNESRDSNQASQQRGTPSSSAKPLTPPTGDSGTGSKQSTEHSKSAEAGADNEGTPQPGVLPADSAKWVCRCQAAFHTAVELQYHLSDHILTEHADCESCKKCVDRAKAFIFELKSQFITHTRHDASVGGSEANHLVATSRASNIHSNRNTTSPEKTSAVSPAPAVSLKTAQMSARQSTPTGTARAVAALPAPAPATAKSPATVAPNQTAVAQSVPNAKVPSTPNSMARSEDASAHSAPAMPAVLTSPKASSASNVSVPPVSQNGSKNLLEKEPIYIDNDEERDEDCILSVSEEEKALEAGTRFYKCKGSKECTFTTQCTRRFNHHCKVSHQLEHAEGKRACLRSYVFMYRCDRCLCGFPNTTRLLNHIQKNTCVATVYECQFRCGMTFTEDMQLIEHHNAHAMEALNIKEAEERKKRELEKASRKRGNSVLVDNTSPFKKNTLPSVQPTPPVETSSQPVAKRAKTSTSGPLLPTTGAQPAASAAPPQQRPAPNPDQLQQHQQVPWASDKNVQGRVVFLPSEKNYSASSIMGQLSLMTDRRHTLQLQGPTLTTSMDNRAEQITANQRPVQFTYSKSAPIAPSIPKTCSSDKSGESTSGQIIFISKNLSQQHHQQQKKKQKQKQNQQQPQPTQQPSQQQQSAQPSETQQLSLSGQLIIFPKGSNQQQQQQQQSVQQLPQQNQQPAQIALQPSTANKALLLHETPSGRLIAVSPAPRVSLPPPSVPTVPAVPRTRPPTAPAVSPAFPPPPPMLQYAQKHQLRAFKVGDRFIIDNEPTKNPPQRQSQQTSQLSPPGINSPTAGVSNQQQRPQPPQQQRQSFPSGQPSSGNSTAGRPLQQVQPPLQLQSRTQQSAASGQFNSIRPTAGVSTQQPAQQQQQVQHPQQPRQPSSSGQLGFATSPAGGSHQQVLPPQQMQSAQPQRTSSLGQTNFSRPTAVGPNQQQQLPQQVAQQQRQFSSPVRQGFPRPYAVPQNIRSARNVPTERLQQLQQQQAQQMELNSRNLTARSHPILYHVMPSPYLAPLNPPSANSENRQNHQIT